MLLDIPSPAVCLFSDVACECIPAIGGYWRSQLLVNKLCSLYDATKCSQLGMPLHRSIVEILKCFSQAKRDTVRAMSTQNLVATDDYYAWSVEKLVQRVKDLERELRDTTIRSVERAASRYRANHSM